MVIRPAGEWPTIKGSLEPRDMQENYASPGRLNDAKLC
jgi:hypothetical protein